MPDDMFNEAVQALKAGQRLRAKDLFTRLIKVDQANPDYWLWMSAAVDTEKEQVFCLQNVLKRDPNSIAARRGLVVLGALSPAEAGLPPADVLENTSAIIPDLAAGPGGLLSRRRNRELLIIGAVGLFAVAVLAFAGIAVFAPGLLTPKRFVVVTSTAAPSQPPTATLPAGPTATACTAPTDPDPATPLAAYLCLNQTATPAAIPTEASISEDYNNLKVAYQAGDWPRILGRAGALLADPALAQNARIHFYIAEAYRHTGNLAAALKDYRTAAQLDTGFAPAYWGKARVEIEQNKSRDALADFDAAITADPGFVVSYLDRAVYSALTGNQDGALADLQQAQAAAPHNALVLASLAAAYVDAGNLVQAHSLAESALALDPALAPGYYARGLANYAQRNFSAADADLSLSYRYLLQQDVPLPARYQALVLYRVGLTKAAAGIDPAALALLTQALSLDDTGYAPYLARGELYLRAANYDAARADLTVVVNQLQRNDPANPDLAVAYAGLGQVNLALDQPDVAVTSFQAALRVVPNHFAASLGLGQAYLALGQVDDAIASMTSAVAAAVDPSDSIQARFWRARAYEAAGRIQDQVADLLAANALLADNAPASGTQSVAPTIAALLTAIGPLPTTTPTPTETPTIGTPPSRTPTATRTPRFSATPISTPTPQPGATSATTATVLASKTQTPMPGPTKPTATP